ncbi:MAG: globin [Pseudomonadales bacterium]|nr:globin [Pseudomonadales bacterium]
MTDPILTSFELAADKAGDVTDAIYEQYFKDCPGSEKLMEHVDPGVKGKMIQEVLRLIMVDDYQEESDYLNFEVNYHQNSFSVEGHMYANLLRAVHTVVKHSIASEWTEEFENAWVKRIEALSHELTSRHKIIA